MSAPIAKVLPIYFVADESYSMIGNIGDLNAGLTSLLDELHEESVAAAMVRFSVIGFSGDVDVYMEPTDLRDVNRMPTFKAKGGTSYVAAFEELVARIPADIEELKRTFIVLRPAVFFLSDGAPTDNDDEWKSARKLLESIPGRPNIMAFGIGNAVDGVIRYVASEPKYAFIAATGVDTGRAIREFITALTRSVINSGNSISNNQEQLMIEPPKSFISLAIDPV